MAKCLDLHFRIQIESIFGLMEGGVEGKIRFHQHMCCDMKQGPSHSYRRRPQQFPLSFDGYKYDKYEESSLRL